MATMNYDVCIIGSGAGAGPIAYTLAKAGYKTVILEKGPYLKEDDFFKDEIAACRRNTYTPHLQDEPHVLEDINADGQWISEPNTVSGWSFWNGNVVGGSSNFMSGYFHRMKPVDFKLLSEFGLIEGGNIVDWPISYDDLEPYYDKVEKIVGISGKIVNHPGQEPRSSKAFPFKALVDHPFAHWIDKACKQLGYHSIPMPRAIITKAHNGRKACIYSVYCGSYGCNTGAKGSSRAALINIALQNENCEIIPKAMVYKLESNEEGNVETAYYYDKENKSQTIKAKIFVVACQAVESSRLLLASKGVKHPNGLGNNNNQIGKNLLFSGGGLGQGTFHFKNLSNKEIQEMKTRGPFVNRAVQDWYTIKDKSFEKKSKGGTIDFLQEHPNPIRKANRLKYEDGKLLWGNELKQKMEYTFKETRTLQFEVFNDWIPTDDCFVSLDESIKDKWGLAVAKIRIGYHKHDIKIGKYLAEKAKNILKEMGAENISSSISGSPPANLMAGGCRFGENPKTSVLNPACQIHDAENVFVTDGSFMPTGGSVPYTWTIYANSFRVADIIKNRGSTLR